LIIHTACKFWDLLEAVDIPNISTIIFIQQSRYMKGRILHFDEYAKEEVGAVVSKNAWKYLSEGGAHIIFSDDITGVVLRLPKVKNKSLSSSLSLSEEDYLKHVALSWFEKTHILTPIPTEISIAMYGSLMYDGIDNIRPSSRVIKEIEGKCIPILPHACVGHYLPNLYIKSIYDVDVGAEFDIDIDRGSGIDTSTSKFVDIAFDLKVKCGIPSHSPFIPTCTRARSLKKNLGRYKLMELFRMSMGMRAQGLVLGTSSTIRLLSKYDPCDLCSCDPVRVKGALLALLDNPRNNLKIYFNGKVLFSEEANVKFDDIPESHGFKFDDLLDIVASALCCSALSRLQALQRFDAVLDVEGCHAIMVRLEGLVGSAQVAEDKVKSQQMLPLHPSLLTLLLPDKPNPYPNPDPDPEYPEHVERAVGKYKELLENHSEMDTADAELWVRSLGTDECAYLLHVWLAALAAKDASAIIRVSQSLSAAQSYAYTHTSSRIPMSSQSSRSLFRQDVKLTLIDIGPKHVSKIRQRIKEEEGICVKALNTAEELARMGLLAPELIPG